MKATVAVCTHNRAEDTREAVQSVLDGSYRGDDMEIIVVDNGSTDTTAEVIGALCDRHGPRVRYVYEQRLGLSVARNRAIREARGEYILFLDDDALASREWVEEILHVFEGDSGIGCVGGRIDPIWEAGEPAWIPDEHRSVFTILDFADSITEMEAPAIPYGANVAFRTSALMEGELFREDLGRVGSKLLSSEESELIARLRRKHKVVYTPHGSVRHKIAKTRTTRKWFLRRIFWQGVSDAVKRGDRSAWAMAKHIIRMLQAIMATLPAVFHPKAFIRQVSNICYRNGTLVGILRYGGKG
ncbi:glycosyltransferase [Paenibacillus sp. J5C_2022]|uniref:glycosyltransferase family 2 protein n=1 Tax=Paenibacillus sp. J5C2022 TaxID=2977129 RepID=UPI0021CF503F|nr:glycosyltransferase family 2 protein [Paenibacillus sp. J5C2022]MCU6707972.1 glycosyltransferase [Paenibacillus sp. J5C2022]